MMLLARFVRAFPGRLMLVAVLACVSPALAVPIPVSNPGFEANVLGDGGWTPGATGWITSGDANTGTFNPPSGPYPVGAVPQGSNVGFSNGPTISQVLPATLAPNVLYSLQVDVGDRTDGGPTNYFLELVAGGTVLRRVESEAGAAPLPASGGFAIATLNYLSPSAVPAGQPLEIRLGKGAGGQINFDNVRLDAYTPIAVKNPSFEADFLPGDETWTNNAITDWVVDLTQGFANAGAYNPPPAAFLYIPDGDNIAFSAGRPISQQLDATLAANTRYVVQAEVGNRLNAGFPGYSVQLGAGGALLADGRGSTPPQPGEWVVASAEYTARAGDPLVGSPLEVTLRSDGSQTTFDSVVVGATAAGDIAYAVPPGAVGTQAFSGALGMDFDVNAPTTITQLGVFDSGSDGLTRPITARLYNRDTQAEIATLSFTGTDGTLVGGSRLMALGAPVELPAGFRGTIVAENYGPGELNGNNTGSSVVWSTNDGRGEIAFVGSARWGGAQGAFPTNVDGGPANRYAAGTFEFEPAPVGFGDQAVAYVNPVRIGNQEFSGSLGMDFNVSAPIEIAELGVFDSGANGLSRTITARLYNRDTQQELASLVFSGSDGRLLGGSRFQDLAGPIKLPAGFHGTIVAENYGPGEPNGNQGNIPLGLKTLSGDGLISFVGGGRWGGAQGAFPTVVDGGPPNRYAAGTFVFAPYISSPAAIPVPNFSFEQPPLGEDGWTSTLPGWTPSGSAGNYNPPPGKFIDPIPHGQQVAWVNSGGLFSDQLPEALAPDTLYILQVDVGDRLDSGPPPLSIALRAGGTTLGWANNTNIFNIPSPGDGQFGPAVLYARANHGAALGTPLDIFLSGGATGQQAVFDNVRLSKVTNAAVPLLNPSFEADDVAPTGGWQNGATGWVPGGAGGGVFEQASEIVAADGTQSAFIRGGGSLTQTLTGVGLMPGYRYVLLADVGDRWATAYGGYALELLAGGQLVAADIDLLGGGDDITLQGGFYLTAAVDYQVPLGHPLAGQELAVRLSAPGGVQTYFDNVSLYVFAVPEPTTLALLGLGGLGLAIRRRRRAG